MPSYRSDTSSNQFFISKVLKKISNLGLSYDIKSLQNSYAIGANDDLEAHSNMGNAVEGPYMYDIFTKKVISKVLDKKSIAYLDRSYFDKRKILSQYSIKDEIRDFINQIADETVIFDDNNKFCTSDDLPDEFDEVIRKKVHETFDKLYNTFGFNDGIKAWHMMRDLLIDGFIAYEIVYDKKQKEIVDMIKLDPITLVPATDPTSGSIVWVQYPDDPKLRRILLDAQIIYISYGNNNDYGETSYVEPLIRPYNQLKLMEQTKIIYNINQAAVYKKFIIPVGGLSRQQAEQQIYQLMSEYHEDVQWDDNLGTMTINGSSEMPHSKDFWLPSSAEGTPEVTLESPGGNDINEDMILNWFMNNLKRASRMPFSRFEKESGGGNIYNDASEMTRDEIKFHNFIRRIRTIFREIMVKPLKIQMMRDFPELIEDHNFIKSLNVRFVSNELFEEWKYLGNLEKRANIASTLISNLQNSEGEPYLAMEWIVREIMKFNDEDIAKNQKYKIKEKGELTSTEGGEGGEDIMTGPGADFFAQGEGGGEFGGEEAQGMGGAQEFGGEEPEAPQEGGAQEFGGEEPETPPQSQ
jgi:capsid assembly protein Gp20